MTSSGGYLIMINKYVSKLHTNDIFELLKDSSQGIQ